MVSCVIPDSHNLADPLTWLARACGIATLCRRGDRGDCQKLGGTGH